MLPFFVAPRMCVRVCPRQKNWQTTQRRRQWGEGGRGPAP